MKRFFLIPGILWLTISLVAQDSKFTASAPATVKAGQQFQYKIEGTEQVNVTLPQTADFNFVGGPFTSFSSSTQWINGKMTATTTASYTYVVLANNTGDFEIPPAKVQTRKETFKTNPVKISVVGQNAASQGNKSQSSTSSSTGTSNVESSDEQPVFLRILPSKRDVYVGEQFVSELKVFTSVNTQPTSGLKEVPYEGFYKHSLEADKNSTRENINGQMHVTQVLQRHVLIPQKSGKLVIEPFESEWTIPQRVSRRGSNSFFDDPFSDPFFDRIRNVPVTIRTKPVTINVKKLPNNAPGGFTGGVGNLTMSAELSADNLKVNDALSLAIKISGTGNISLLGAPKVDFPPDHDVYETTKSINISTSGNRVSGNVIYEYPLVVRHAGKYRISPVKFSWFDPVSESYKTITSPEFNFVVEKSDEPDDQAQIYIPGNRGDAVEDIGTDILDIRRTVPDFNKIGKTPLSGFAYWSIYIILLAVFAAASIVLRTYYKRKADIRLTRNKKANKMARNRLKVADKARKEDNKEKFFEEIEKAIWGYLADKLSIEISTLSKDKVSEVLNKISIKEKLREELERIIDECEFSRYAPSEQKADIDKLFEESIKLIRDLEHNIRSK